MNRAAGAWAPTRVAAGTGPTAWRGRSPRLYEEAELAHDLGQMVYDRRTALGLSQTELADRCGMQQPQLSRIEGGGTVPTIPLLRRLARALDVELTINLTPHGNAA